jgi:hypothetical protein
MRRHLSLLLAATAAATPAVAQPAPAAALEVIQAFRHLAAMELWPDFKPGATPVEFFDGATTYLFNVASSPEGFHPVASQPNVYAYPGQHPTVRGNTGTLVNGVPTATADISQGASAAEVSAALLLHETFHVFEAKYFHWSGNEVALFTYPASDAGLLTLRRLESIALVRALEARRPEDKRCWAARALAIRTKRFAGLPPTAVAYERSEELYEGLAQYVQDRSIGKSSILTPHDFPAGQAQVRQRAYASGEALGLLLDGLDSAWKSRLGGDPPSSLDSLLASRLQGMAVRTGCDFTDEESLAAREKSQRDVADFVAGLHRQRRDFLAAKGVRLEVIAGKEPLWPQAFDPWNVLVLDDKAVLHTRMVKLGNGEGTIEVLGRSALTEAAGEHPLFNGVRRLVVTGLVDPKVSVAQDKVTLEAEGLKGTFSGTLERQPDVVRIRLP